MTRVKRGVTARARHKKVRKELKGHPSKVQASFKLGKMANVKAKKNAYEHRRLKKRTFRALWITRLSAAAKMEGMNYSTLIKKLKDANVLLDRKALSNIAAQYPEVFKKIVETVK